MVLWRRSRTTIGRMAVGDSSADRDRRHTVRLRAASRYCLHLRASARSGRVQGRGLQKSRRRAKAMSCFTSSLQLVARLSRHEWDESFTRVAAAAIRACGMRSTRSAQARQARLFPPGSVEFDSACVMQNVEHEWKVCGFLEPKENHGNVLPSLVPARQFDG